jgi:two-component system sensor histidine kinase UhpB
MTGASPELESDYESALQAYLKGGGEEVLKRAYDLGRRAVNEGAGLLSVILLHQQALAGLMEKAKPAGRPQAIQRAMQFLAESMAPFEMAHRGFQEAYARVRELNEEYESVVAERTREFRNAETRFRAHVEQLPAITYIESVKSRAPVYISPQIETALGFTPRQWLEDPGRWAKQIHPEDVDRILVQMSHFREGGPPFEAEYRMTTKEGREIWVRHEATKVLDETGRPQFTQGVLVDITDRKRAEFARKESDARFRDLFAISSEALLVSSAKDERLLDANPAAAELLGYELEALKAKSLADLFPEEHARIGHHNGHKPGEHPWYAMKARRADGTDMRVRLRSVFTRMGQEPAYLCVVAPATS